MFERYTQRARRTILSAVYIARQSGSPEIEPEHILLGLLKEDPSLARRFLGSPWALDSVWERVSQSTPTHEKPPVAPTDHKLSSASKRVLDFAGAEASEMSDRNIGTQHLLLGLLRGEKNFAAEILHQRGLHLEATREELIQTRHDEWSQEDLVRESSSLPEVVELQTQIKTIMDCMKGALADHDREKARIYLDEERATRDKLYLLCRQRGLSDWLYDWSNPRELLPKSGLRKVRS
jgi:ATP-dependent Clp protease ATP-binding subunit ClpC